MDNSFWDMEPIKPSKLTEWVDMPEFVQNDLTPFKQLIINFNDIESYKDFELLVGQKLTLKTKSIWHPAKQAARLKDYVYKSDVNEK